jgi:hypothetical protein
MGWFAQGRFRQIAYRGRECRVIIRYCPFYEVFVRSGKCGSGPRCWRIEEMNGKARIETILRGCR